MRRIARIRTSSADVGIYDDRENALSADGWVSKCERHGTVIHWRTRQEARAAAQTYMYWCTGCFIKPNRTDL